MFIFDTVDVQNFIPENDAYLVCNKNIEKRRSIMRGKKINNGKKSGRMTGQSAVPDCILENLAYEAACGTLWLEADGMSQIRGPTLI